MDEVLVYCQDPQRLCDDDGKERFWVRCNGIDSSRPEVRCKKVFALPRAKQRVADHVIFCPMQSDEKGGEAQKWALKKAITRLAKNRQALSRTSTSSSPSVTITQLFSEKAKKNYQTNVEAALVKLACDLCIPPYSTDRPSWRNFMDVVSQGVYTHVSGTRLVENLIVNEAAYVREQQIAYLQSSSVEMITYDFDGTLPLAPMTLHPL